MSISKTDMQDAKSLSRLKALGVELNDPDQMVAIYFDRTRSCNWLDQRVIIMLVLGVPTFFVMLNCLSDKTFLRSFGLEYPLLILTTVMAVAFVVLFVSYAIFRFKFSFRQFNEPILKIERDGITFRCDPLRFNLMRWDELGEVSVGRSMRPIVGDLKVPGDEFLSLSPVNPNTLYDLAVDEKTKNAVGRIRAVKQKHQLERYRELPPMSIGGFSLPSPLTPADLVFLINTRRALCLNSNTKIPKLASEQELAPTEEKSSVIEIKRKIKFKTKTKEV